MAMRAAFTEEAAAVVSTRLAFELDLHDTDV